MPQSGLLSGEGSSIKAGCLLNHAYTRKTLDKIQNKNI
jgi:hypothetical protein